MDMWLALYSLVVWGSVVDMYQPLGNTEDKAKVCGKPSETWGEMKDI